MFRLLYYLKLIFLQVIVNSIVRISMKKGSDNYACLKFKHTPDLRLGMPITVILILKKHVTRTFLFLQP